MSSLSSRLRPSVGWLALLLTVPALLPLTAPGYFFNAHDARHSVFFLVEFDQAIRAGALWPVWAPDQAIGFGYPLWLVYAPLAFYIAEGFHLLLGLGLIAAVKATWALAFLVGAGGMYRLARRWWGPLAGLTAALAYTYAPYHLVQIYVRAALAEFVALAWFPWVLLAFDELWTQPGPRRAALAALSLAALLLTHTVSTLILVPLLGGFLLIRTIAVGGRRSAAESFRADVHAGRVVTADENLRSNGFSRSGQPGATKVATTKGAIFRAGGRIEAFFWLMIALVLGGLLAAIFWLPMLLERGNIAESQWVQNTYAYTQHFIYPAQFFSPAWGFGYSVEGPADGLGFQIGLLPFLGAVAYLAQAGRRRPSATACAPACLGPFLLLASGLALFAMTPAARPIWDHLPLVGLIQFPWRLLAVPTVTLALLTAAAVNSRAVLPSGHAPYIVLFALALALASFPYTRPELTPIRPQDESPLSVIEFETKHPDMRGMTRWSERIPVDADSPLLAQYRNKMPLQRAAIISGSGEVVAQEADAVSAFARVRAAGEVRLRFYIYYFPGWQATVNGRAVTISPDPPNGLIGLTLPAGEHEVHLHFGPTPVRRIGAGISLTALAVVVGLLISPGRRRPAAPHADLPDHKH